MLSDAPIFIVGPPRSGTHLLRFCLTQHSRIYIAPETFYFLRIYCDRKLQKDLFSGGRTDSVVDRILSFQGDPTMGDLEGQRAELKSVVSDAIDYRDFAEKFFGYLAQQEGKARWGEKSPLHALYISQILSVFPNAKIVYVMREAKNTLASTLKSTHVHFNFFKALAVYKACLMEKNRYDDHSQVFSLDYEAFVEHPAHYLEELCVFLGEEFESIMLSPGMADSSYSDDLMERRQDIGIRKDDPLKWRRGLSDQQGAFIDSVMSGHRRVYLSTSGLRFLTARVALIMRMLKNRLGYFSLAERVSALFQSKR